MSVFQSPDVLPENKNETGIGASFVAVYDDVWLPNIEIHSRWGLGNNLELGAKLYGLPGLAGGFMSEIKYQFLSEPIYASIDGGIGCLVTNDATYFDGYPMIIIGSNRFYGGYRGIFRTGNYSEENTSFQSYTHGVFIGNKVGPGPYLRPEIHVYSGDFKDFFYVFGLGLQF